MGVSTRRGVHVLTAALDGGALVRLGVEAEVRRRGWLQAWSPADADVLVVCGPASGWAEEVVERLWLQLPGPRARVDLESAEDVSRRLDDVVTVLGDRAAQDDLAVRADSAAADVLAAEGGDDSGDGAHMQSHDMSMHKGSGSPMDSDMGMESGMDTDMGMDMDMSGPAGIPLAQGSDNDRDGLEMDVWHVVLGPGLLGWPAGLVLQAELHGDVVTGIETVQSPTSTTSMLPSATEAALVLDAAAAVLELAGWSAAAERARTACFAALHGAGSSSLAGDVERLHRRVSRSRLLRWSFEGMRRTRGPLAPGALVRRRLLHLLQRAAATLRDPEHPAARAEGSLDELRDAVLGQDLGTLRLLVAGLALDAGAVASA